MSCKKPAMSGKVFQEGGNTMYDLENLEYEKFNEKFKELKELKIIYENHRGFTLSITYTYTYTCRIKAPNADHKFHNYEFESEFDSRGWHVEFNKNTKEFKWDNNRPPEKEEWIPEIFEAIKEHPNFRLIYLLG
jgi:hypothetical protein